MLKCLIVPPLKIQTVVRLSAQDLRTNTGKNLLYIARETGLYPWLYGTNRIKSELKIRHKYCVPEVKRWRFSYLEKLIWLKLHAFYESNETLEEQAQLWLRQTSSLILRVQCLRLLT